ncbi:MAG TPA: RNA repair transcriptional activator RtcR [Humisphaera sp.]|nr:RNA repair transcriptional activator RtcR [Humisphaera sp.]
MAEKRTVVLGLLGPVLDNGKGPDRWERWRPSVSVCQQDDLLVHRFDLLFEPKFTALCKTICEDITAVSPETAVCAHEIHFEDPWDFEDVYGRLLDFIRGYPIKPDEEEYLVHITTGSHVAQICWFLLAESRYLPAKLLQTAPPGKKPRDLGAYYIVDLDLSKYDRLASRFNQEARESTAFLKSGIETRNPQFNRLIEQIEQVALGSKSPILLMGPTGAGKSKLARQIYELKKHRRQIEGKFVEVNCATVRGDGAMSALFGHTRGAFTGAVGERAGLLRAADGGLLFLDEVGELGPDEQAMLLRAIEERRFLPVGSDKEVNSDFQLIAGTNCDLKSAVSRGRFREDLLARINLWTFELPALRDRREDIEPNLDYELDQFARNNGVKVTMNKEGRQRFLQFALDAQTTWTGNFRDLNAAVTRMATLSRGGRITVEIIEQEIKRLQQFWEAPDEPSLQQNLEELLEEALLAAIDPFDRVQLEHVVSVCRASRSLSEAGRKLFAVSRSKKETPNDADRLRKYLLRFGLEWGKVRNADG